jgi:hypothetical protein
MPRTARPGSVAESDNTDASFSSKAQTEHVADGIATAHRVGTWEDVTVGHIVYHAASSLIPTSRRGRTRHSGTPSASSFKTEPYLWWDTVVKDRLCSDVCGGGSLACDAQADRVDCAWAPSLT